jgi:hypothetical protein
MRPGTAVCSLAFPPLGPASETNIRIPSPHPKPCWAGSLPAWCFFDQQTGPKAPSVIHPARTQHSIPFVCAGSLPAWICFEKQTGPKAPSVIHPARTQHQFHFPVSPPFPPGLVLKSRRRRRPRLSAIPPEQSIQFHFHGPAPFPIHFPWVGSLPARTFVDKQTRLAMAVST